MAPVVTTQPTFTVVDCDPTEMAAKAGLAIVPVDLLSSPTSSDHIVAIAVGVGVPGGLLLITILVFIVVIYLNVRQKRLQDDCNKLAKEGRATPESWAPARIRPFPRLSSLPNWRISTPQSRPPPTFTHTPNRSFSSVQSLNVPPSYHSTEEQVHEGSHSTADANTTSSEEAESHITDDPPPSPFISASYTSISSKLPSPAPSAMTFSEPLSPPSF